jgi:hypothetical protein
LANRNLKFHVEVDIQHGLSYAIIHSEIHVKASDAVVLHARTNHVILPLLCLVRHRPVSQIKCFIPLNPCHVKGIERPNFIAAFAMIGRDPNAVTMEVESKCIPIAGAAR